MTLEEATFDDLLDWLIKKRVKLLERKADLQKMRPLNCIALASTGGKVRMLAEVIDKVQSYSLVYRLASGYGITRSEAATLVIEGNKQLIESLDECEKRAKLPSEDEK